jgi:translation initiation factor IF-3
VPQVRVVDEDGSQLGIMSTDDARRVALERDLDLVEIAPTSKPPVCKLMNYGKFCYQQSKKAHEMKKHQKIIHVKEVKFRPRISEHDYEFKKNHITRFLEEGDKVKVVIMFRGREIVHKDFGWRILDRLQKELGEIGMVEKGSQMEGSNLIMVMGPKKAG